MFSQLSIFLCLFLHLHASLSPPSLTLLLLSRSSHLPISVVPLQISLYAPQTHLLLTSHLLHSPSHLPCHLPLSQLPFFLSIISSVLLVSIHSSPHLPQYLVVWQELPFTLTIPSVPHIVPSLWPPSPFRITCSLFSLSLILSHSPTPCHVRGPCLVCVPVLIPGVVCLTCVYL